MNAEHYGVTLFGQSTQRKRMSSSLNDTVEVEVVLEINISEETNVGAILFAVFERIRVTLVTPVITSL